MCVHRGFWCGVHYMNMGSQFEAYAGVWYQTKADVRRIVVV
jgi:hypothetical protein